jgi:uncharacterized phage protein gp47/JayE
MTYDAIITDMLGRVTSDVDKREGSVIYDAIAPCALQLAQAYFCMDQFIDLVFGDSAIGEYLDRVVADYGITRKQAIKAIRQIETNGTVAIGTRWGLEDTTYIITEEVAVNTYKAQCEQEGAIGNHYTGALENIDNVSGITATLTNILTSGEDIETDDNLRSRFYAQVQSPSTSGNADNYTKWALEVPGVGDAKVFPLWNGTGTVKVLVVDENMAIDEALPATVATYIETVRPIGAIVTVDSPTGSVINVAADVLLDGTKTLINVQEAFMTALAEYLKGTVFDIYSVSYARIGSLLLSTDGVRDYNDLLVNSGTANIIISPTEMPVAGTVTLTEVS